MIDLSEKTSLKNKCVVRLKTPVWTDRFGLHVKKDVVFLRRKSHGFNMLEEEFGMIGADRQRVTVGQN